MTSGAGFMFLSPLLSRLTARIAGIVILALPLAVPPEAEAAIRRPAKTKHAVKKNVAKKTTPKRKASVLPAKKKTIKSRRTPIASMPETPPRTETGTQRMARNACQRDGKVYLLADCGELDTPMPANTAETR
jgi:hypothetical protein